MFTALTLLLSLLTTFPSPQKYVADTAQVLDGPSRDQLNALLRDVERDTTAEIAVVTVPSLDGLTVEDYANRLFKEWGIGKKGSDNGVLILVSVQDRKMRIEVGYGLEPILPDGLAGEIIRSEFLPRFRADDYPGGIRDGVGRVAAIVRARHVVTEDERRRFAQQGGPPALITTPFFGVFVGFGAFMIGAGLGSKTFFPLIFGALFGGIPFLMSLVPFFNATPLLQVVLAFAAGIFGYRCAGSSAFTAAFRETGKRGRHGRSDSTGWVMGTSSSGSSSSGSSGSSGGDSFGGGSSGGGGASGSW